jgi:hypothetical protein
MRQEGTPDSREKQNCFHFTISLPNSYMRYSDGLHLEGGDHLWRIELIFAVFIVLNNKTYKKSQRSKVYS